jgi:hypothetical protein
MLIMSVTFVLVLEMEVAMVKPITIMAMKMLLFVMFITVMELVNEMSGAMLLMVLDVAVVVIMMIANDSC